MNRLPNETLIDFTLRYLRAHTAEKRFQQAPPRTSPPCVQSQREAEVLGGGPQPAVRLLDNSEDIAEEYSKSSGPFRELAADAVSGNSSSSLARGNQGQEITGLDSQRKAWEATSGNPAPESKSLLCTLLDLRCEVAVDDNQYGVLRCQRDAVGICKHCGLPVCLSCVKWEFCSMASRHEVIVQ